MLKYQRIKLQATVENFRSDKARTASVVNDFKNDQSHWLKSSLGEEGRSWGKVLVLWKCFKVLVLWKFLMHI